MDIFEQLRQMLDNMKKNMGFSFSLFQKKPANSYKRVSKRTGHEQKIMNWQSRERASIIEREGKVDIQLESVQNSYTRMKEAHYWVNKNIAWDTDQRVYGRRDYWATSDQVLARGKDDCDGQAVAIWRKMRDAGLPDLDIGMIILVGGSQGHMVAGYFLDTDFYVLDNGYMTRSILMASELFSQKELCKGMRPVAWFNLWQFGAFA